MRLTPEARFTSPWNVGVALLAIDSTGLADCVAESTRAWPMAP
jgi:hypothetical protein